MFPRVNPVLLIWQSVSQNVSSGRLLESDGRTTKCPSYLWIPLACFTKDSAKRCLSPADKTAPIMPHSHTQSVGRILLAAADDLRFLLLLNFQSNRNRWFTQYLYIGVERVKSQRDTERERKATDIHDKIDTTKWWVVFFPPCSVDFLHDGHILNDFLGYKNVLSLKMYSMPM